MLEVDDLATMIAGNVIVITHICIKSASSVSISQFAHESGFHKYFQVVVNRRYTHVREIRLQGAVDLVRARMSHRLKQVSQYRLSLWSHANTGIFQFLKCLFDSRGHDASPPFLSK